MDMTTYIYAIVTFVGWGLSAFLAKIATNKIGEHAVFWDLFGYVPGILLFCFLAFKVKDLMVGDKAGIAIALLSGIIGSIATICFYYALTRRDASIAVPLTALYPALTAILAFIFLRESLTVTKIMGIVFACVAIILLGK